MYTKETYIKDQVFDYCHNLSNQKNYELKIL